MSRYELEQTAARIRAKLGAEYDVAILPSGKIELTRKKNATGKKSFGPAISNNFSQKGA